jgi:hypothetical protein
MKEDKVLQDLKVKLEKHLNDKAKNKNVKKQSENKKIINTVKKDVEKLKDSQRRY